MLTAIDIAGSKFNIEGEGFVQAHASADFDQIVALIQERLTHLDAAELGRLHAGSIFNKDGAVDQAAFDELSAIVEGAASEVLKAWHDPSGAFVTIAALTLAPKGWAVAGD